jgi:hypothetical protein
VSAAPQSTERKVLIAGAGTFVLLIPLLMIPAFARPAPLLFDLFAFCLVPTVTIAWLMTAFGLAWNRKWRAALIATILFLVVATGANWSSAIGRPLAEGAVWLEFVIHRASYDDLVSKAPKSDAPRLIRVSQREIDDFRPHFEEIWFDEADELGSADILVRRARVDASHRRHLDQTRHPSYGIRPLGAHYYFVDIRN